MNPFEEGYEAARQGKSEWDNPYVWNTSEHKLWLAGFKRWARNIMTIR